MTSLVALSISIGVLGGIATWLALSPLAGIFHIWIGFIGWATYFATGGNNESLKTTIVCGIWGAICAWVAGLVISGVPVDSLGTVWPAIVVGVTVLILCLGAHVQILSNIPASVYGYAVTAALMLLANGLNMTALTSPSAANPLVAAVISLIIGALFGIVSGKVAGALAKS